MAERAFKETRHKQTTTKEIICNEVKIVLPQTLRKDILKSVHDNVHCGIMAKQRRWPRYSKEVDDYIKKMPKMY